MKPSEIFERAMKPSAMCERGNTLLLQEDGSGVFFCGKLGRTDVPGKSTWLFVEFIPENYPSFNVWEPEMTEAEVAALIQETFAGWFVRRMNVEGVKVKGDCVAEDGKAKEPSDTCKVIVPAPAPK